MIKLILTVFSGLVFFTAAASGNTCYQVSDQVGIWSRTPEVICVEENAGDTPTSTITLETGLFNRRVVATFELDLLQRARCMDCNQDVYGLANPSNSVFNSLKISFDGQGVGEDEAGTVTVGANKFFYRHFSR